MPTLFNTTIGVMEIEPRMTRMVGEGLSNSGPPTDVIRQLPDNSFNRFNVAIGQWRFALATRRAGGDSLRHAAFALFPNSVSESVWRCQRHSGTGVAPRLRRGSPGYARCRHKQSSGETPDGPTGKMPVPRTPHTLFAFSLPLKTNFRLIFVRPF